MGGGINEIGHTGDMAYSAEYHDFSNFKENMYTDFLERRKSEIEKPAGLVTDMNFNYIHISIKKDKIKILLSCFCDYLQILCFDFGEEYKDRMRKMISDCSVKIFQIECIISEIESPLSEAFIEEFFS